MRKKKRRHDDHGLGALATGPEVCHGARVTDRDRDERKRKRKRKKRSCGDHARANANAGSTKCGDHGDRRVVGIDRDCVRSDRCGGASGSGPSMCVFVFPSL